MCHRSSGTLFLGPCLSCNEPPPLLIVGSLSAILGGSIGYFILYYNVRGRDEYEKPGSRLEICRTNRQHGSHGIGKSWVTDRECNWRFCGYKHHREEREIYFLKSQPSSYYSQCFPLCSSFLLLLFLVFEYILYIVYLRCCRVLFFFLQSSCAFFKPLDSTLFQHLSEQHHRLRFDADSLNPTAEQLPYVCDNSPPHPPKQKETKTTCSSPPNTSFRVVQGAANNVKMKEIWRRAAERRAKLES